MKGYFSGRFGAFDTKYVVKEIVKMDKFLNWLCDTESGKWFWVITMTLLALGIAIARG
jgi:hypothetical protein